MTAAIRATTAHERATIAAAYIRRGATTSRGFDSCFEMGDGDEVIRILRAKRSTAVRAYVATITDVWED